MTARILPRYAQILLHWRCPAESGKHDYQLAMGEMSCPEAEGLADTTFYMTLGVKSRA